MVLPPEFSARLHEVEQGLRETGLQLDSSRTRLQKLREKQEGICLNRTILDQAETIEDLHLRLGEYRKGRQDRGELDGMRIACRKDAEAFIEEIRPGLTLKDAESLRPVLSRRRTIQDLSSRYEVLHQQATQSRKQKEEAEKELEEIAGALSKQPAPRAGDGLAKAIRLARRVGDIDVQIEELSRGIEAGKKNCHAELKRLGLWAGDPELLPELTLPLLETVRRFEIDYAECDSERRQLKNDRQKTEKELKAARDENREVAYGGEVPLEEDLEISRKKRQDGWKLLRRQWIDGDDVSAEAAEYAPGQDLPDAYEQQVEKSDLIADRLRREAERVSRAAVLRARIESLEETMQGIIFKEKEAATRQNDLASRWRAEWEPIRIKPLSPKEMLGWLSDMDRLRLQVTELFAKERLLSDKNQARQQHRQALAAELKGLGESGEFPGRGLEPLLLVAESILENIGRRKAEREKLSDQRTRAKTALNKALREQQEAETAKIEWQQKWDKAL
ncbi:MAG: hypothetical protein KAW01_06195, partial [Deltaproteobacteria bacterium]|nr:hypothetical protein [Deltaproteobacteria bacterium]